MLVSVSGFFRFIYNRLGRFSEKLVSVCRVGVVGVVVIWSVFYYGGWIFVYFWLVVFRGYRNEFL